LQLKCWRITERYPFNQNRPLQEQHMYFIYNLFLTLIFILLFPFLFIWAIMGKHGVQERLGRLPAGVRQRSSSRKVIWFHAASVGEIKLLPPIVSRLKRKDRSFSVVVSSLTKAGKTEAQRSLKGVDLFFYLPADLPLFMKKVMRELGPSALVLVETEIWPNLIRQAKISGSRIVLINGRFSSKSFQRYFRMKSFFRAVLSLIDLFCMRTQEDAQRLLLLGADPGKVTVVGNLKFDTAMMEHSTSDRDKLRDNLGIPKKSKVVVAGSTEQGEERMVLDAFKKLKNQYPGLFLILAPRHLNRIKQVESELTESGLRYRKRTQIAEKSDMESDFDLILLDTIGELFSLYSIAEVTFVGGSLIPFGGHNVLEPAMHSVPVLFGPYMDHFKESSELLLESGGAIKVRDSEELYQRLSELLHDENKRKKMGEKARELIERRRGPTDKTVEVLLHLTGQN